MNIIGWIFVWYLMLVSAVTIGWIVLVEVARKRQDRRHRSWLAEQRRLARNEVKELQRERYRRSI
jgi:hypothetical protein